MPKKREHDLIACQYGNWLLWRRGGIWQADGRANSPPRGRHSLGVADRYDAIEALRQLDRVKAVELGLAPASILLQPAADTISLARGREIYLAHVGRPRVAGGAKPATPKRYRAVLDKFGPFAVRLGLSTWNQVTANTLLEYAAWLDGEGYAYRTEYTELTTLKQVTSCLIRLKHLPKDCSIDLSLRKPTGTDTYCWRSVEVQAMIAHCRSPESGLDWLGDILVALTYTGMRISELAALRCDDVDLTRNRITLVDESYRAPSKRCVEGRTTKSSRSRTFPIHPDLRPVLERLAKNSTGLVFHGPKGGTVSPDIVRRTLIGDVLKPLAGTFPTAPSTIGFCQGRVHSFRHFFASFCANSNVPEQTVMAWLGHAQSAMVRHYYHLHDDEAQRHMQRLNILGAPTATVADPATDAGNEAPEQANEGRRPR